jgi:hypothetical protein
MKEQNATVGVFKTHNEAADAVKELNKGGFPMRKVSIIGKELQEIEDVKGYYTWKDQAKAGAGIGAFWGSLFGILVGVGFLTIPGIGPLFVAGSLAGILLGGAEGALVGSIGGGLFGSLLGLGINKAKVIKYQEHIAAGKYLVIAHGSVEEVEKARQILKGAEIVEIHK